MEAKHTAGLWFAVTRSDLPADVYADGVSIFDIHGEEGDANAYLIAEAGTVANETGLTPRQLAEERSGLLEALIEIAKLGEGRKLNWGDALDAAEIARAAIARAGGAS